MEKQSGKTHLLHPIENQVTILWIMPFVQATNDVRCGKQKDHSEDPEDWDDFCTSSIEPVAPVGAADLQRLRELRVQQENCVTKKETACRSRNEYC